MKMHRILAGLLVLAAVIMAPAAGQVFRQPDPELPESLRPPPPPPVAGPVEPTGALSLRKRVSQLMLVGLRPGSRINSEEARFLSDYPPGGIAFGATSRPRTVLQLARQATRNHALAGTGIPPFLAIDLYAVSSRRLTGANPFYFGLPAPLAVGAADDPEATARYAELVVESLKAMGLVMHLGPSLSLAPELPEAAGSPMTLGSRPLHVAQHGAAIVRHVREAGLIAVPMDFPGAAWNATPGAPPMLLTTPAQLFDRDVLPYQRVIDEGARMIHVGPVLVPTIEEIPIPAFLSPDVTHGLLRRRLGFEGVVLAGPLDSPVVGKSHDPAEAALRALAGGADMLWWATPEGVPRAVDYIVNAVEDGVIEEPVIAAALARIVALKEAMGLLQHELPKDSVAERFERSGRLGNAARWIERRGITLVKNAGGVLPLTRDDSIPVGVTGVAGVEPLRDALEKPLKHVGQLPLRIARHDQRIHDFEIERLTRHAAGTRTAVLVLTNDMEPRGVRQLIGEWKDIGLRVVVILLDYPRLLPAVARADAILLAHGQPEGPVPLMAALADTLIGEGAIGWRDIENTPVIAAGSAEAFRVRDLVHVPAGELPVDVPGLFDAGWYAGYDLESAIDDAEWDFGDGEEEDGLEVTHAYEAPGRYTVTLTIEDEHGDEQRRSYEVIVE